MEQINEMDRGRVISYMMRHHCGYKAAAPRKMISRALEFEDRYFRAVCASIPEIITSVKFGYWILPLVDTSGMEIKMARDVVDNEERRRMIALYLRQRKQRNAINKIASATTQYSFV